MPKRKYKFGDIISSGYLYNHKYFPTHPRASKFGYIQNSRWIMEKKMRRFLKEGEIVHHINENKKDDRIENLRLYPDASTHQRVHAHINNPTHKFECDIESQCFRRMVDEILGIDKFLMPT